MFTPSALPRAIRAFLGMMLVIRLIPADIMAEHRAAAQALLARPHQPAK